MKLKRRHREAIADIMKNFDWDTTHRIMRHMKWQWGDQGVPTIADLQALARQLLQAACKEQLCMTGTGGLCVMRYGCTLRLSFEVTDWDHESNKKL